VRSTALAEDLREIAESIVDTSTKEGQRLLEAASHIEHLQRLADHWKKAALGWEKSARAHA
jgi:hypothetical protein